MYIFVLKQGRDYSSLVSHMMDLWKSGASMRQEITFKKHSFKTICHCRSTFIYHSSKYVCALHTAVKYKVSSLSPSSRRFVYLC